MVFDNLIFDIVLYCIVLYCIVLYCIVLYCIGKLLLGKCFKSQPTDKEYGKKGDSHQCIQVSALYLFEFGNCNVAELV